MLYYSKGVPTEKGAGSREGIGFRAMENPAERFACLDSGRREWLTLLIQEARLAAAQAALLG